MHDLLKTLDCKNEIFMQVDICIQNTNREYANWLNGKKLKYYFYYLDWIEGFICYNNTWYHKFSF